MRLSPNFTLRELTRSKRATEKGIDNRPTEEIIRNLQHIAPKMERIRKLLGNNKIKVSSGYRCLELNTLVGGSKNSAHMRGLAVDFTCNDFGTPEEIVAKIRASTIEFDQCILEFGQWVHISFAPPGKKGRRSTFSIN